MVMECGLDYEIGIYGNVEVYYVQCFHGRGLDYPHNIAKLSEIILWLSRNYPKIIRSFFWFSDLYLVTFYRFVSISIQIGTHGGGGEEHKKNLN